MATPCLRTWIWSCRSCSKHHSQPGVPPIASHQYSCPTRPPCASMADASARSVLEASPEPGPAVVLEEALRCLRELSPHGAAVTEGFVDTWLALENVSSPLAVVAELLAHLRPDASLPAMTLEGLRELVASCDAAATVPDFSAAPDADVRHRVAIVMDTSHPSQFTSPLPGPWPTGPYFCHHGLLPGLSKVTRGALARPYGDSPPQLHPGGVRHHHHLFPATNPRRLWSYAAIASIPPCTCSQRHDRGRSCADPSSRPSARINRHSHLVFSPSFASKALAQFLPRQSRALQCPHALPSLSSMLPRQVFGAHTALAKATVRLKQAAALARRCPQTFIPVQHMSSAHSTTPRL